MGVSVCFCFRFALLKLLYRYACRVQILVSLIVGLPHPISLRASCRRKEQISVHIYEHLRTSGRASPQLMKRSRRHCALLRCEPKGAEQLSKISKRPSTARRFGSFFEKCGGLFSDVFCRQAMAAMRVENQAVGFLRRLEGFA